MDSGGLAGKQILISSYKKKAGLHTGQKSFGVTHSEGLVCNAEKPHGPQRASVPGRHGV